MKTIEHYLRKYRRHFTLPPIRVEMRHVLAMGCLGVCFPPVKRYSGKYLILLDVTLDGDALRDTLLHELAHAEAMHLHYDYEHGPDWIAVCARVSAATGINIE